MRSGGSRARKAEATRQRIVDVASVLFTEQGYGSVSIQQIVEAANVTRGALYHHFENKLDLFTSVFHAVEMELSARASPEPELGETANAWARYRLRIQSFLDAILQPRVQRILLIDGPAVMGWSEWRDVEARYGLGAIERALDHAMETGCMPRHPPSPLAHIILAAINEAALLIANSSNREADRREVGRALDAFLAGIAAERDDSLIHSPRR